MDRSPASRPKDGGNVISAVLSEAATGEPAKEPEAGKPAKFHRDKAVGIVNSFINLKEEISKDRLLLKNQKQKLHRAIDSKIKPLKAAIEAFDKSPLTTADQKKDRMNPDKWKIK